MADAPRLRPRPTSPSVWIWRWHVTMAASILHRASGVALYGGALILMLFALSLASGPDGYAAFQGLTLLSVGTMTDWLEKPPTKIVCVGDPDELDALEIRLERTFDGRLTISKSLPYFLEFSAFGITKGAGLDFLAAHMGFSAERTICFGDGENDVELVGWGGFGVAVENAHARVKAVADWVCPPAADEGVAAVLEALLDSRS